MYKVIQTYLQGARHRANNLPCEDRTYAVSKNGVDVIALADGAGSQKYSSAAQGAECVTKTICEFFCVHFDDVYNTDDEKRVKYAIMTICQNALRERAKELMIDDIITMSSTLLCVAVKGNKAVSLHIGDGAIGGIVNNNIVTISAPDNGEFASTTFFITMPQANEFLHIKKFTIEGASVFFMMSDGTQEYAFDEQSNTFTNGAAKMALCVYEKNGQRRLTDTIQSALIDEDSTSDDCSFIALKVSNKKPDVNFNPRVAPDEPKTENDWSGGEVDMDMLERQGYQEMINYERSRADSFKKQIKMLRILVIGLMLLLIMLVAALCIVTFSSHKESEPETTTVSEEFTKYNSTESSSEPSTSGDTTTKHYKTSGKNTEESKKRSDEKDDSISNDVNSGEDNESNTQSDKTVPQGSGDKAITYQE